MQVRFVSRYLILIITFAILIIWLGGFFHSKVKPGNQEASATVISGLKTFTVSSSETPQAVTAFGTVQPMETVQISAKVMARITSILAQEGDRVRAGDTLVTLDRQDAALQQSQAYYQANQAAAQEKQAKAVFDQAEINLKRTKQLYESGAAPKADLDAAQTAYDTAKAAYETAKAAYGAAQAGYGLAGVNVGYSTITAPFAGLVVKKLVDTGNMASPGMPLLTLEKTPYRLEVNLDESLTPKITKGMKVRVFIDSLRKKLEGVVDEILPTVDVATRTFTVKIALPRDPGLRSGMFGSASFNVGKVYKILVPAAAIIHWSQFTGVFTLDDNSVAHLRFVRLGETFGDQVEVLSGLKSGDIILTEGLDRVKDGYRVEVVK